MTHSRIEDLVDAYIVSKQEYIIVDVAPNGTTNRKL